MAYYSERQSGPLPRTSEEITEGAWKGIWALVIGLRSAGAFGNSFPGECQHGRVIGNNYDLLEGAAQGDGIIWPPEKNEPQWTLQALDLLEFCHRHVATTINIGGCFYGGEHLGFNVDEGRAAFRKSVEEIFVRHGIAFEMSEDGEARRIGSPTLMSVLQTAIYDTGDPLTDSLLETARRKILDPEVDVRKEGLQTLWDAFERIKTEDVTVKKKASVEALLKRAVTDDKLRDLVTAEMKSLTDIGNEFTIRHFETGTTSITKPEQIDYLFERLYSVIHLLLRAPAKS